MVMLLIYWGEEWSLPGGHSWEAANSFSPGGGNHDTYSVYKRFCKEIGERENLGRVWRQTDTKLLGPTITSALEDGPYPDLSFFPPCREPNVD